MRRSCINLGVTSFLGFLGDGVSGVQHIIILLYSVIIMVHYTAYFFGGVPCVSTYT